MLSIVITHHQTPILLKLCLKSIKESIVGIDYDLIITDCETEPKNEPLIRKYFPKAQIISFAKNVGYAKIVNEGIKAAKGKYVLILNADIILQNGAVAKLIDFMEKNADVGIVGPQLLTFNNTHQDSCFKFPTIGSILARRTFLKNMQWGKKQTDRFVIRDNNYLLPKNVDWLQGSAMLVRKEAIAKVGLWDERFFMYFEDTDWCRRFWQDGYKVVYLPVAHVFHYYGRQSKRWGEWLDPIFNKYTRIHLISAFKYFWKWRRT